jgi:hypothetical protein
MFPNVRLMIVAVLASIMGISCALGLFAEFRVSHDSLLRESTGSPLQFGASRPNAAVIDTAASFEVRFQAQPGPRAVVADVSNPAPVRAAAPTGATGAPGPQLAPAAASVPAPTAPQSPPDVAASPPSPPPHETSNTASEASIPAAAGSVTGRDSGSDSQKNPEPKVDSKSIGNTPADSKPADYKPADYKPAEDADGKPADSKSVDNKPADSEPAGSKPADDADGKPADSKPADRADNTPAESRPADTLAGHVPTAPVAAREAAPASPTAGSKIVPKREPAAVPRGRATVRHRPFIARRVVPRARTASPAQSFTTAQPFYQWTSQPQPAPPVRRRLIIRRARSPAKSAQTAPPTVSNTAAANPPK